MEQNVDGTSPRPRVGIGVMIENNQGHVLMGLRNASHGAGEWSFPGGHLEFGETIYQTAKREVEEETGLIIDEFELVSVADEMRYIQSDGKHYLNIGVKAVYNGGEPQVLEPHKCAEWRWFALDKLPEQLFEATELMLRCYQSNTIYQPTN